MTDTINQSLAIQDFRELAAFTSVVRTGSLTASARILSVPKPTLSRRISQLEERLGQRLLRRESKKLVPTEAGILFVDYCHQLLQLAHNSQRALDTLQDEIKGDLYFAFHNAFTRGWLGDVLEDFMSLHSQLRLHMRTCFSPPHAGKGEEISLWLGEMDDNGLRQEQLGMMSQGIYASPAYLKSHGEPSHPRELVHLEWIDTLAQTAAGVTLTHPKEGSYLLPASPSLIRVDQLVLQGDAIVRGKGLGFFPNWLAELRLKAHPDTMQRCLPEWTGPTLPVWLLYPYGQLSKRSQALLTHLRASTPKAILSR